MYERNGRRSQDSASYNATLFAIVMEIGAAQQPPLTVEQTRILNQIAAAKEQALGRPRTIGDVLMVGWNQG